MIPSILSIILFFSSCSTGNIENNSSKISENKYEYWHNGKAEISSYKLTQARYGELYEGTSTLIFVTEPFSTSKFVKADNSTDKDISVLKLNNVRKFNTGIYPYSIMTSTFFPFEKGNNSLKISSSSQEWCGHTFMELKNKKQYEINLSSYFEDETQEKITLEKNILEDDIWTMIRLKPEELPIGELNIIPSFFYLRLMHKETKAYTCTAKITSVDGINTYILNYPNLDRIVKIKYEANFPYHILAWSDQYYSGWGKKRQKLKTTAERITTIRSDYWNKHSNKDSYLRKKLGLE